MTGKDLFREVGNISEKYITEAEETKKSIIHNATFRRSLGTAACLVLCVGIFAITRSGEKASEATSDSTPQYIASDNQMHPMDGTNNVQMNTAEQDVGSSAGNSSWEEFWDSVKENEQTESSVEKEDYTSSNAPEEVVGEEPSLSDREWGDCVEDLIIERLQSYSNNYEELLQTDAFVVAHGTVKSGMAQWETFVNSVEEGVPAYVDVVQFTDEGDAIITGLYFAGEYFCIMEDHTRDAWGKTGIVKYEYQYLYTDTRDGRTVVILSDLQLEGEDIQDAIMSYSEEIHFVVEYMEE